MFTCACGCGQPTTLIVKTNVKRGLVRGEYRRFVHGHNGQQDLETRFWSKVEKTTGCWLWRGTINVQTGYGMLAVTTDGKKRNEYAHRLSLVLTSGPIPPGMFACHTCDNPPCVNPAHLFLGANVDNMVDAASKGRLSGPRRPAVEVSPAVAAWIVTLATDGVSQRAIGRRLSLSRFVVGRVLRQAAA